MIRNVYENATDGYGVIECASLTCLSSPCQSYATCVEFGDSWNCLCPSGYVYAYIIMLKRNFFFSFYKIRTVVRHLFVYCQITFYFTSDWFAITYVYFVDVNRIHFIDLIY